MCAIPAPRRYTPAYPNRHHHGLARLHTTGRVLIRASGTEPLIRVMAEGEDSSLIAEIVDGLCATIAHATQTAEAAE